MVKSGRWFFQVEPLDVMSYTIHCAILGDGTVFQVDIDSNHSVLKLKRVIAANMGVKLGTYSAINLNLYHVDIDISEKETSKTVIEIISRGSMDGINNKQLNHPVRQAKEIFQQGPPDPKHIHIIVECE